MHRALFFGLICLLAMSCSGARAAVGPAASSPSGHSWFAGPHPISGELVLHHLPPSALASRKGQVTVARLLNSPPVAIAAYADEVYVALAAPEEQSPRVYSLRAVNGPADAWQFIPGGRLRRLPSFPEGVLSVPSLAATRDGVYALDGIGNRVLKLTERAWVVVAEDVEASSLLRIGDSVFSGLERDDARVYSGIEHSESLDRTLETGSASGVCAWRGDLYSYGWTGEDWRVVRSGESGSWEIGRASGVPETAKVVLRADSGRLAWIWRDPGPSEDGEPVSAPGAHWRMVEISLLTGREIYRGPAGAALPVNADDFRVLAFVLFVFTALVLVGSLGPRAADQVLTLPDGLMLAAPSRRAVGWLIDAVPGLLLATQIFGFGEGASFVTQLAGLVVGCALSHVLAGVSEGWSGTSFGKWVSGCRVVSVRAEDAGAPLGFSRSIVRNFARWHLLPVGVLGVFGAERRHIGDLWTHAAVVVDRPRTDEPSDAQD